MFAESLRSKTFTAYNLSVRRFFANRGGDRGAVAQAIEVVFRHDSRFLPATCRRHAGDRDARRCR